MKLQIMSDLHLEFMSKKGEFEAFMESMTPVADTLILAGDIAPLRFLDQIRDSFLPFCERWREVIYVPGNHEYYGVSPSHAEVIFRAFLNEVSNLHYLTPGQEPINIRGTTFWGGTMWFQDGPNNGALAHNLNDFELIKNFVPWVYQENRFFIDRYPLVKADVVVTHHLPSPKSADPRFTRSPLNVFFVCDMEYKMRLWQPKLWVHGHTHMFADYKLGDMRVVCNPRGYPRESLNYDTNFVVEI